MQSLFADQYVGAPVANPDVKYDHEVVERSSDGTLSLEVIRKCESGHHPIPTNPFERSFYNLLWAIGETSKSGHDGDNSDSDSACASVEPSYHQFIRGRQLVNWMQPEKILAEYMKC